MADKKKGEIKPAKGRPMLTWVGKRPLRRVTAFPAQHIETFAPKHTLAPQAATGIPSPLRGEGQGEGGTWTGWPDRYPHGGLLFHGDNKEVLAHLLAEGFRGKVNLVYIDPPFDSGADYMRKRGSVPNRIEVIELRTDPKYGKFFTHQPARAKVAVKRAKDRLTVTIEDFISPTVIERLQSQAGLLKPRIDDWRAMVDCIMIDAAWDGSVFTVALSDVPEKKTDLVAGSYDLQAPKSKTMVAVKIIDVLGEEILVTVSV